MAKAVKTRVDELETAQAEPPFIVIEQDEHDPHLFYDDTGGQAMSMPQVRAKYPGHTIIRIVTEGD